MRQRERVIIAILVVLGVFLLWKAPQYIQNAREAEARVNIASIQTSLHAFYTEYSEYTDDIKAIGWVPESDLRYHVYLSANKICPGVRAKLKDYQLPFVDKKNYRIIAIGYNTIFIQDLDKPLVREDIEVSLKELSCEVKEN